MLNEYAPIKVRTIPENHVRYMYSELCKLMYRRTMLKNNIIDKKNNFKFTQYKRHRNKCVSKRRKAITD